MSITVLALPATFFLAKGITEQIAIRINKKGIYEKGKLVTSWNNFINAYILEEGIPGSVNDDFALFVEYTKGTGKMAILKEASNSPAHRTKPKKKLLKQSTFSIYKATNKSQ